MKTFIAFCISTMLLLGNASTGNAADQDFSLVNKTGVEINALFVSPADKNDWGEDILGQDTLPAGQKADISFEPEEEAAKWDLRVQDKEGNAIEWTDLDLTEISTVTLFYEGGKATAKVE